mgnify:CR=1 FL=1
MSTLVRTVGISVRTIFGVGGIRRLITGTVSIRREPGTVVRKRRPVSNGRRRRRRETAHHPYEKTPPADDRRGRAFVNLFSTERIIHPIYFVQLLTG